MTAPKRLSTVVISLKTGTDIKGVLRETTEDAMVLSSASVAGTVGNVTVWRPLPGEVVVPMDNIEYYQRALPAAILDMLEIAPEG